MRVVFYLDLFVVVVVVVVLSGPFFKLRFLKGKDITREEISTCALALSLSLPLLLSKERKSDDAFRRRRETFLLPRFLRAFVFRPKPFFDSRRNHNRVFVLRIGKKKKGRETFSNFHRRHVRHAKAGRRRRKRRGRGGGGASYTRKPRRREKKSYSAAEGRENVPGRTRIGGYFVRVDDVHHQHEENFGCKVTKESEYDCEDEEETQ